MSRAKWSRIKSSSYERKATIGCGIYTLNLECGHVIQSATTKTALSPTNNISGVVME